MNKLSLTLFGTPRITLDDQPLHITRRKAFALLAYLAVVRQPCSRSILAALLWHDYSETAARAEVRRVLSTLKRAIGDDWLHTMGDAVELVQGEVRQGEVMQGTQLWIDVLEFRALIAAGKMQNLDAADAWVAPLTQAVELARGDFLAGFSLPDAPEFEQWQRFETESLQRDLAWALAQLSAGLSTSDLPSAVAYGQRWLALDPLHEPAHRRLMELYATAGDPSAAFRQYQECVGLFKSEFGAPPSEELIALYEQIRSGDFDRMTRWQDDKMRSAAEPPATSILQPVIPSPLHNLPAQTIPFVGRSFELGELTTMLNDSQHRLITITGPGGIGKTRLALQLARQLADDFPHRWPQGIYFVNLSALENSAHIASAIAERLASAGMTITFQGSSPMADQLVEYLRQKQVLLLLDNLEQLLSPTDVEPLASLIDTFLQQASGVTLLATSRERLNFHGETVFNLIGMPFPAVVDADLQRYDAVKLFVQSALRADRGFLLHDNNGADLLRICHLVQGMPLAIDLAAAWVRMLTPGEIAAEISQSLEFLAATAHNLPARHRSMLAVFDHSWRLLGAEERSVFCRLSIFRGGFTRQSAQRVADASLPILTQLCDKSLLRRSQEGRFVIHELLRQFAKEKLSQQESYELTARHARHFLQLLSAHETDFAHKVHKDVHALLRPEIDNMRQAWDWAVQQPSVADLASGLQSIYHLFIDLFNAYDEGIQRFQQAAAAIQAQQPQENTARLLLARLWSRQAMLQLFMGNSEAADPLFAQSLQIVRTLDHKPEIAFVLSRYCLVQLWQGNSEQARQLAEEGVALFRTLKIPGGLETALTHLGFVVQQFEEFDLAEQLNLECLAMLRKTADPDGLVTALTNLGVNYLYMKQPEKALPVLEESLSYSRIVGNRSRIATSLGNILEAMTQLNRLDEAMRYGAEALAIFEELGQRQYMAVILNDLGRLDLQTEKFEEARQQFQQSLAVAQTVGVNFVMFFAIAGFAELFAKQGHPSRAVRLLTFTLKEPSIEPDVKARAEELLQFLQESMSAQEFENAQRQGQACTLAEVTAELLF